MGMGMEMEGLQQWCNQCRWGEWGGGRDGREKKGRWSHGSGAGVRRFEFTKCLGPRLHHDFDDLQTSWLHDFQSWILEGHDLTSLRIV